MPGTELTPARLASRAHLVGRQAGEKPLGSFGRIIRFGYRANDDNATRPGFNHLLNSALVNAANSEPWPEVSGRDGPLRRVAHQLDSHRCAPRFGRCSPHRTDAKVVESVDDRRGIDLVPRVSGETDSRCRAYDPSSGRERQVFLTDVQDRSRCQAGDVGSIVGGPEPTMALGNRSKNLEKFQLLSGFDGLVSKLDDVHSARERRFEKLSEIATIFSRIGAQVQAGSDRVHSINSKGHLRRRGLRPLVHPARPNHG